MATGEKWVSDRVDCLNRPLNQSERILQRVDSMGHSGSLVSSLGQPLNLSFAQCISIAYFSGFALVKRQLAHERELPPPYVPGPGNADQESTAQGMRRLLGLNAVDDGTHDMFSEEHSNTVRRESQTSSSANDIEMREVRVGPLSVANSASSSS